MSYQALARQFRPRNFSELVGQEHVSQALINGLDQNRLHHAFLFTGTRGVGKTTIARILAKSLNCKQGVSGSPCGECSACKEIDEGKFVDLIEVDAASRTGVDDTRELLDNVQYAPTSGRYKIYLIDEVHMFSRSSFNALLKTLEEPPEHVKFLLATTEPEKLPVTVLSRCLQFNLKRLNLEQISDHLQMLLKRQGFDFESTAIELIARAADGSMRDGLSLLDQALAYGAGKVLEHDVKLMLGTINQNTVINLLESVIDSDAKSLSSGLQQIFELAPDYSRFLQDMALLLHELSLAQILNKFADNSRFARSALKNILNKVTPEQIQLYYQIVVKGQDELRIAPDSKTGFEMTIIRMFAFKIGTLGTVATSGNETNNKCIGETNETNNVSSPQNAMSKESPSESAQAVVTHPKSSTQISIAKITRDNWPEVFSTLKLTGLSRELARNVKLVQVKDNVMEFVVDQALHSLVTDKSVKRFNDAIAELTSEQVLVKLTEADGAIDTIAERENNALEKTHHKTRQKVEENPFVRHMQENFDAELIQIKQGDNFLEV